MLEKTLFLIMIYVAMFVHDGSRLMNASGRRERLVYGMLMFAALYLSILYIFEPPWPNVDEFVHFFLEHPAKRIVDTLKIPSE